MNSKCPIPGYMFGQTQIARSTVSLDELHKLEAATGWSEDDARWLRIAADTLVPQSESMVDSWRSMIGSLPQLAASFVNAEGQPDEHYKSSIKPRFVQWISDTCLRPHDQDWLDYQDEIGLRHTPAKKNQTDGGHTPPVVPERYLLGFSAVVITSVRGFLAKSGRPEEELNRMQDAWIRAVLLTIALWARTYAREDLW